MSGLFFFNLGISPLPISYCADLFSYAYSHPAFIFGSRPPFLRQISGMPCQPSSSGLDCWLRQMELGCMENVHFLASFFSICKTKVGVSSTAVCSCSHAHSPYRSAHPCHWPWAWPQDVLWPTNVRPHI